MKKNVKEKRVKAVPVWMGILVFLLAFGAGVVSKFAITPGWSKDYSVKWSDELGTLKTDLPYGEGEANKFDLYLPKDGGKDGYGLAVYLHAGGFTSGDKADDQNILSWLCSKGYVAAGINYTLRTEENGVDFRYFELPHSGHALQNDNALSQQWIEAVEQYLNKYMPVK